MTGRKPPRPWWPPLRRLLVTAFFLLTAVLLVKVARDIDWGAVLTALGDMRLSVLLGAACAAFASYGIYATFDVLGKRYTGHHLRVRDILPVTFVCYAFNLSLGAWIGSVGLRYRLYSRLGLDAPTIGKILGFSLTTNWLGHGALAAALFTSGAVTLPGRFALGGRGLGLVWLLLVGTYLLACAFSPRRVFTLRGHRIELPNARLALCQVVLGACNWALMALTVFILLEGRAAYPLVLGTLMISAIAGVAAHIPAGLGVIEAVFVAALSPVVPAPVVLAALLGYRALYFLLPLALAALVYLLIEVKALRQSKGLLPAD